MKLSHTLLASLLALSLCGVALAQELTVLTHDSFNASKDVLKAFSDETGIKLTFIEGGDAGESVNRAILTKDAPVADVLYGVDNNLIAKAKSAGIFEPYQSPLLKDVSAAYLLDETHTVTPIDVGYVNFNYDVGWFQEHGIEPPADISDLTKPAYRGLTVVANPVSSSPGLAFMLATIDRFGEDGWLGYWAALKANDLQVTSGWSDAYYTAFTRYGGDRPIVLSYATSPAAEMVFAEKPLKTPPTANLFCQTCVFEQVEGVGILKGSKHLEEAKTFIDFMLGKTFQEDIPLNMFVYPVNKTARLPEVFNAFADKPAEGERARLEPNPTPVQLDNYLLQWSAVVEQGREPESVQ